jgi:hypothetical protein
MSIFNSTNYPLATPVADDYLLFTRDADGVQRSVDMTTLAALLQSLASLINSVTVYSGDTTLTTEQFVEANSGAVIEFTLLASSLNTGRAYRIYNKGAGALTITPDGADTINGAANLVLAQYESAIVQSDGLGAWAAFGAP